MSLSLLTLRPSAAQVPPRRVLVRRDLVGRFRKPTAGCQERLTTNLCIFFSLQEKLCMESSLSQETDAI